MDIHTLECASMINSTVTITTVPSFPTSQLSSSTHNPDEVNVMDTVAMLGQELAKTNTTINNVIHRLDFTTANDDNNDDLLSFLNSLNVLNSMTSFLVNDQIFGSAGTTFKRIDVL